MERPQKGRLREAMNSYRRRLELDILATRARLEAADRLADAVEAGLEGQPAAVRDAVRAYRDASQNPV